MHADNYWEYIILCEYTTSHWNWSLKTKLCLEGNYIFIFFIFDLIKLIETLTYKSAVIINKQHKILHF